MEFLMCFPILFPMLFGILVSAFHFDTDRKRNIYVEIGVIINSIVVAYLLLNPPSGIFVLFDLTKNLTIEFHIDKMSMVFAGIVSILWPFASLYAFEYMENEHRKDSFFTFYTMTYGITIGVAFAGNLETMYLFYEMLTLVTLPLVMHEANLESIQAAKTYMVYSIAGASFGFISLMFILNYGETSAFVWGGVLKNLPANKEQLMRVWYAFAFFGFGVKAAVFPFHGWLPKASVAPTPVTALLHAVAVVKSGAFAIGRLTYFSYGTDILKGTWVQYLVMSAALITILFGSCMAYKEQHIKRRLAYSTVSNLSYIVFGFTLMSGQGLIGGMAHMLAHAFMKIVLFACVGAIMVKGHKQYVYEIVGIGKAMPFTMVCFAISALAVTGVPPLPGFISKWNLIKGAVLEGGFAYVGVVVLLISGLLTAMYIISVAIRAFIVDEETYDKHVFDNVTDPGLRMKIPFAVLTVVVVVMGIFTEPIVGFLHQMAQGL